MTKKYINEWGKECYKGVKLSTPFQELEFHLVPDMPDDDKQWALHTNIGSITVLDRMTGFGGGLRDVETGFRDKGKFWLASGLCDVRASPATTFGEAVAWIKAHANTCRGGIV